MPAPGFGVALDETQTSHDVHATDPRPAISPPIGIARRRIGRLIEAGTR